MSTHTTRTFIEADAGCYLDNHRGHYITRDMIQFACDDFGYILSPMERYAVDHYEDWSDDEAANLADCLHEISDDILSWLNGGPNEGLNRPIKGQNSPPIIPAGFAWDWNDGDFGLYAIEDLDA